MHDFDINDVRESKAKLNTFQMEVNGITQQGNTSKNKKDLFRNYFFISVYFKIRNINMLGRILLFKNCFKTIPFFIKRTYANFVCILFRGHRGADSYCGSTVMLFQLCAKFPMGHKS